MWIRMITLVAVCVACVSALASQAPPVAYPLESAIKSADHVFLGRLDSAKRVGDSVIYDVSIIRGIWGGEIKSCMTSKLPYEIGSDYFFFVTKGSGACLDGGNALRRGLPVKTFSSKMYVVFQDEKYLYPNFGASVLRVDSIPLGSDKPITLWSGVPIELLEARVTSLKAKRQ